MLMEGQVSSIAHVRSLGTTRSSDLREVICAPTAEGRRGPGTGSESPKMYKSFCPFSKRQIKQFKTVHSDLRVIEMMMIAVIITPGEMI